MANDITAFHKMNIGHGVVANLFRRDNNSIIIHIADNMENAHGEGTTKHSEKLPLGWRPSLTTHMECVLIIGESFQPGRQLEYVFYPDGSIWSYSKGNTTVPVHVVGTAVYMMADADIKEARNPTPNKPVTTLKVERYTTTADTKATRYTDELINGARGTIEMMFINDDVIRATIIGEFSAGSNVNGLHIGTIPTGGRPGHQVIYPLLASSADRSTDGFIQINNDGRIYVMGAIANKQYTFDITLPVRY